MSENNKIFGPLKLPTKILASNIASGYRVFAADGTFVDAEAQTVIEAIEKSGIAQPMKVQRLGLATSNVMQSSELTEESAAPTQIKEEQFTPTQDQPLEQAPTS